MKPLLAIVGPTASGKTEYGLRLAKEIDGEIISVDSRQVYRFLSIGTAKPKGQWTGDREQFAGTSAPRPLTPVYLVENVPYHLVDIWDPAKVFSAADFIRLATERIEDIQARKKIPIFVGGTGLYLKAFTEGLAALPPRDEMVRAELREVAETKGRAFLHRRLARVDPEAAKRIPANNIARVIRALEVHTLTKKPITHWHREHQTQRKKTPGTKLILIGSDLSRETLHQRIENRCRAMLEKGLIEETQHLLDKGYAVDSPALTGLGYPRVIAHLNGQISKVELLELLMRDTRRYAKRQLTWFRHQMEVEWKKF